MHPFLRSSVRAFTCALALALVLSACASAQSPAATVAGADITTEQLASTAAVFASIASLQQSTCGQVVLDSTDTQDAACNRFALSAMIQFRLAENYASANGVTVDDADVQKTLDAFESNVGKEVLGTQLAANNVTIDDVRELVRLSLVQDAVAKAVTAAELGDAGLQQRYHDSIGDYTNLHVDHILVDSKAEAQDVYDQVTVPGFTLKEFQALAKKVSTDPNAPTDGGELQLAAGQLVPEFSQAAMALKPGEISKPVQTQYGWHVIYMIDQNVIPFEKARDQILQATQAEIFSTWVSQQNADGQIEVDPSFGRYDDAQMQVVRIDSTDPSATESVSPSAVNGVPASP
jgi:parvulin-like peptidyl-prolyl isomerase